LKDIWLAFCAVISSFPPHFGRLAIDPFSTIDLAMLLGFLLSRSIYLSVFFSYPVLFSPLGSFSKVGDTAGGPRAVFSRTFGSNFLSLVLGSSPIPWFLILMIKKSVAILFRDGAARSGYRPSFAWAGRYWPLPPAFLTRGSLDPAFFYRLLSTFLAGARFVSSVCQAPQDLCELRLPVCRL